MASLKYELLATKATARYQIAKVIIAARYASVAVEEHLSHKPEELQKLVPSAKSLVLRVKAGHGKELLLTRSNVVLRFLAESRADAGLYGETPYESALVDQWLDFSFNSIEVPAAILGLSSDVSASKTGGAVVEAARGEVRKAVGVLDKRLTASTYLAGERLTVADIAVLCATYHVVLQGDKLVQDFPAFGRWLLTLLHQPHFVAVLTDAAAITKSFAALATPGKSRLSGAAVASSGGSKAAAPSGGVDGPSGRFARGRVLIKDLLSQGKTAVGSEVVVKGWARSIREGSKGALLFVELTDGSSPRALQVVLDEKTTEQFASAKPQACGGSGASLSVRGRVVDSPGKGQEIELHGQSVDVVGKVFGGDDGEVGGKYYPMAKKAHSMEYLRSMAHLRSRSKVISSVMRIRHAMAFATHKFFNDRGFNYIHTPLITGADCEGAGEQFCVTTLLPDKAKPVLPLDPASGHVDFSKDFFGRRTCLTVSGQLNVETYACALCDVYTFGPTFRAENSHTTRHLAEFWMIEPEIAFADLETDIALAEDYLKYCVWYALTHNEQDLEYFETMPGGEATLRERLRNVLESPFHRMTYTEAVALLTKEVKEGRVKFEVVPEWGADLGSEHERYLTEKVFQKPVIVTNYPKEIKAFYMRLDDDGRTVAAMDMLVPKIGEIIGGSQREERLDVLERRCQDAGVDPKTLWWYLDLRRYGSVPHAGFGLGFERLILFITGLENIRDVIPFPRFPGHAEF